jgi:hypothetical protein
VTKRKAIREFRRAKYFARCPEISPSLLKLPAVQQRVFEAIHKAGRSGLTEQEITRKTGVEHGSVQSAMDILRHEKNLVVAEEADRRRAGARTQEEKPRGLRK